MEEQRQIQLFLYKTAEQKLTEIDKRYISEQKRIKKKAKVSFERRVQEQLPFKELWIHQFAYNYAKIIKVEKIHMRLVTTSLPSHNVYADYHH